MRMRMHQQNLLNSEDSESSSEKSEIRDITNKNNPIDTGIKEPIDQNKNLDPEFAMRVRNIEKEIEENYHGPLVSHQFSETPTKNDVDLNAGLNTLKGLLNLKRF